MSKASKDVLVLAKPNGGDPVRLDYVILKRAAMRIRAVNHPLRKEILELLEDRKRMTVTEIYIKLRLEQSVASQHLAILRKADVLITVRDGKFIYYSVNVKKMDEITNLVEKIAGE
jgi:ArsR family transcriptional regulator, virulence genes transcriptional regulator